MRRQPDLRDRRGVADQRIAFVKVGRHVRIPASAVAEYIAARTVQPVSRTRQLRRAA
ncbi:excisionase family DNA-binding protein [Streptomyces sp. NRRL S-495]|uniref:excisionase family DNA-binding protein n=1 Tax=Streptomyces sp. NRRL S-495 TaxID=1609133 RepID=UPI000A51EDF0|nr:excisionase family DNA-binding protein [Streptomyces sp. NRRL S-495]